MAAGWNRGINGYRVTTPSGGKTLLYRRWRDMQSRCKGQATRSPWIYEGKALGWDSFREFRAWAIKNGFTKERNSPERIDNRVGYIPSNVVFIPPGDQSKNIRRSGSYYHQPEDNRDEDSTQEGEEKEIPGFD